ncbi:MAG: hypothetical protein Kow0068_17490 [Marinilabiliales bacterium]
MNYPILKEGKNFYKHQNYNQVIDYLKSRDEKIVNVYTQGLKIIEQDNQLFLTVKNKTKHDTYPVRRSFLYKLLKWFNINYHSISHFTTDTIVKMCNDTINAISSRTDNVMLRIENGDAKTIASNRFTVTDDLKVIDIVNKFHDILHISRDDLCMQIITDYHQVGAEPIVGDTYGFGLSIVNSETGFAMLNAEIYILRYFCTNGAVSQIKHNVGKVSHYNKSEDFFYYTLKETLKHKVLQPKYFAKLILNSKKIKAEKYFPDVQFRIGGIIGQSDAYNFFKNFDTSKSKYDLYNFITEKAKNFSLLEKYELERFAGKLLLQKSNVFDIEEQMESLI